MATNFFDKRHFQFWIKKADYDAFRKSGLIMPLKPADEPDLLIGKGIDPKVFDLAKFFVTGKIVDIFSNLSNAIYISSMSYIQGLVLAKHQDRGYDFRVFQTNSQRRNRNLPPHVIELRGCEERPIHFRAFQTYQHPQIAKPQKAEKLIVYQEIRGRQ
jgi:hypothetical protein